MSDLTVRPFARADRDQLTDLVNGHISAVVPGVSVSVATLLARLERDPGEVIVDPWVAQRLTLVAEQRQAVVAAAHLQRYADDDRVSQSMRGIGEITWLVFLPDATFRPDSEAAGRTLLSRCLDVMREWGVRKVGATGDLPAPGVYGVPEQWRHVHTALREAGFTSAGRVETVWIARVEHLPKLTPAPQDGMTVERILGVSGTRFSAVLGGECLGYVELDTRLTAGERSPQTQGLADVGNLYVVPEQRGRGIGTWLMAHARHWLELGDVTRLLDYTEPGENDRFMRRCGFEVLTRTVRDYTLT